MVRQPCSYSTKIFRMARILIVEDSPTQLESIKRIVEDMGHLALSVDNGDQAFDMACALQPDMVIMDILLPGTNGFQATRKLTRSSETAHIPVVILSTKGEESDKIWGLRQGAKAYLTKPVSDRELRLVIEQHLQQSGINSPTTMRGKFDQHPA